MDCHLVDPSGNFCMPNELREVLKISLQKQKKIVLSLYQPRLRSSGCFNIAEMSTRVSPFAPSLRIAKIDA